MHCSDSKLSSGPTVNFQNLQPKPESDLLNDLESLENFRKKPNSLSKCAICFQLERLPQTVQGLNLKLIGWCLKRRLEMV